jgi:transposase-like protein
MASRSPQIRVIARTERRRSWSLEQKRAIVAESFAGYRSVSAIARKHAISPGQLFTWRRQILACDLDVAAPPSPHFARADVIPASPRPEGRPLRDSSAGAALRATAAQL